MATITSYNTTNALQSFNSTVAALDPSAGTKSLAQELQLGIANFISFRNYASADESQYGYTYTYNSSGITVNSPNYTVSEFGSVATEPNSLTV